jgi:hypothetical protein
MPYADPDMRREVKRAHMKRRYAKRRAAGLCVKCPVGRVLPAARGGMCETHAIHDLHRRSRARSEAAP